MLRCQQCSFGCTVQKLLTCKVIKFTSSFQATLTPTPYTLPLTTSYCPVLKMRSPASPKPGTMKLRSFSSGSMPQTNSFTSGCFAPQSLDARLRCNDAQDADIGTAPTLERFDCGQHAATGGEHRIEHHADIAWIAFAQFAVVLDGQRCFLIANMPKCQTSASGNSSCSGSTRPSPARRIGTRAMRRPVDYRRNR